MANKCELCGKNSQRANHVSHSKVSVPRRQKPNLQNMTIDGQLMKVCSSCRRATNKKNK